jgi:putative SOS response-associated peptidase YedK
MRQRQRDGETISFTECGCVMRAGLVAEIHDRMPLILSPADYNRWLSEEADPRDLLRPFPAEPMRIWLISTRVNKPGKR